jgi:hypothetical protein
MSKIFKLQNRDGNELKCYGCEGWFTNVYVIAKTPQEALDEYRDNGGLCEECFTSTSGWGWDEIFEHFKDGGVVMMWCYTVALTGFKPLPPSMSHEPCQG